MMAQEAALEKVGDSKLRRPLVRDKSFYCADVKKGASALFCKAVNRKGTPHWRGPAGIPDIDETGVTVKFQSRTLWMAR